MATPLVGGGEIFIVVREREQPETSGRVQSREKGKQTGHGQGSLQSIEKSKKKNSREPWGVGVGNDSFSQVSGQCWLLSNLPEILLLSSLS